MSVDFLFKNEPSRALHPTNWMEGVINRHSSVLEIQVAGALLQQKREERCHATLLNRGEVWDFGASDSPASVGSGMLRISSLLGNSQRLDGGAMFGNVPREVWKRWCPPDDKGAIELSCRCFLVEDGTRKILIEAGVGAFFEPKLRDRYGVVEREHVLLESLRRRGLGPSDIDVVLLSHLHFDHAGGILSTYGEGPLTIVFERARFVVGQAALQRARNPHPRDRASFVGEMVNHLLTSGRLDVVPDGARSHPVLAESFRLRQSDGHTPGMLIPTIVGEKSSATFCADLIPGAPWVHLPITMGYDRFPERLIDEKRDLYRELGDGAQLLFTHDPDVAAGRLGLDKEGRYQVTKTQKSLDRFELV